MKRLLVPLSFLLLTIAAFAADDVPATVAKVDYREIDDLLIRAVLNVAGNEELRERYQAKKLAAKVAQDKMQAAIMKGEGVIPGDAALLSLHDDDDQKAVERLGQKHLLELIEQTFKGKYNLIFKDDYRSSLIYSRAPIDDVTAVIKQELLKAMPEN